MKHIILNYKLGLIVILSAITGQLYSQNHSDIIKYKGHYKAVKDLTLDIDNKYGDIHLINWDKDSIFISTELKLNATSADRLQKLKHNVSVKYEATDSKIRAYTSYNEYTDQILNELQEVTKDIISNQLKRIEINYTVYVPKYIAVKIKNQYGNVMLNDIYGHVDVFLFHGDLKANKLTSSSSFNLQFAQASINHINDASFNLVYADLDILQAISLEVNSKISHIKIQNVGVYKMHSTRDDINFENVAYLLGQSLFSKINISMLKKESQCEMIYGEININKIDKQCSSIDIESDHTDVSIYVPKNLHINYELTYHPEVLLQLPFETKTVQQNDDALLYIKKESIENNSLDLKISALKKCLIKIQKTR